MRSQIVHMNIGTFKLSPLCHYGLHYIVASGDNMRIDPHPSDQYAATHNVILCQRTNHKPGNHCNSPLRSYDEMRLTLL